jgi:hypothetical protein
VLCVVAWYRAAAKHGIKKVSEELYEFLALATQNRLKDVVDQLGDISKQRLDFYKVSPSSRLVSSLLFVRL